MKRYSVIVFALCLFSAFAVQAQYEEYCRGLKNPTSFIPRGSNVAEAKWYGYTGNKNDVVSQCGNWGMVFNSERILAANLATIASGNTSCSSSSSVDISGQSDTQKRFVIKGSGTDPLTFNRLSYQPPDATYTSSIRLGNNCGGSHEAEELCYEFRVWPQNALITIWYALSLQNGQHTTAQNPEFAIEVEHEVNENSNVWTRIGGDTLCYLRATPACDASGNTPNVAPFYIGSNGLQTNAGYGVNIYLPWNKVVINLSNYLFQKVRLKIGAGDCSMSAHYACAYIAGDCQPVEIQVSGCPRGATTALATLTAPAGLTNYVWYRSDIAGTQIPDLNHVSPDVPFVRLTPETNTSNTFVADTSHFRVHLQTSDGRDSIGLTNNQVFRCDITSYMNPTVPNISKVYVRVINTKPLMAIDTVKSCESTISLVNKSFVPNTLDGCDTARTSWWFYEGSDENTPLVDSIIFDPRNPDRTTGKAFYQYPENTRGIRAVKVRSYSSIPPEEGEEECYTDQVYPIRIIGRPMPVLTASTHDLCDEDQVTLTDATENAVRRDWIFETNGFKDTIRGRRTNCPTTVSRGFQQEVNPVGMITYNGDYGRDSINTYDTIWCTATAYDTILLFSHPELMKTGDSVVCKGEKTDITVSTRTEGCTFKWYRTYMGSTPFASGPRLQVAPYADTSTYYVLVTSPKQCTAWDSVNAYMVIPTLGIDKHVICAGDSVTLFSGAADHYTWSAHPADASLDAQLDSLGNGPSILTVKPKVTTTYTLVGHGTNGCSASPLTETVDVHPLPIARVSTDPKFIDSDRPEVTFSDVSAHSVQAWWFFPNADEPKDGSPVTHNFGEVADSTVPVRLVVANDLGCLDTLDFTLPVVLFTYYAPNVFRPDGDEETSKFRLMTINEMEHFHITIYDRRGQMVYKSDDLHFEWDGTRMDGEKCPQGTYVYVATYRRPNTEDIVTQKGVVTLIR